MRIKNAIFVKSVASNEILNDLPEIAFCGRSNVGKSSLINAICGQNKLAKTSSVPGKTRLINYFALNNKTFYLVDLPGYGYHKAGKQFDKQWSVILENYLSSSKKLKLCLLLVDLNVKPSENDKMMMSFLAYNKLPYIVIGTKADKIAKSKINNAVLMVASELGIGTQNIIPVSSSSKLNIDKILELFDRYLGQVNGNN